ncbi:MAG: SDR family oxidoreductase [Myxococcota bacterium]
MSRRILILGATSGIARSVADAFAERGEQLVLAARNLEEAERIAADLRVRHQATAEVIRFDATDHASHAGVLDAAGKLDGVVVAFGTMVEQERAQAEPEEALRTIDVNFTGVVSVLERVAARFEEAGAGFIAGISSVAGDRGRMSNYIYGSAKAGMTAYLSGLRNRLTKKNVHVVTVKPGFVYTAMTHGLLDPDSPLVATPEKAAKDILRAVDKRRNVLYTPWFWRWIMAIIRAIPEPVFKRLGL